MIAAKDALLFFKHSLDLLAIGKMGPQGFELHEINERTWSRWLGWSRADIATLGILGLVHAEDQGSTAEAFEELRHLLDEIVDFENRLRHRDGSFRVVEWRAKRSGDAIYLIGRDTTETRRALSGARHAVAELGQTREHLLRMNESLRAIGHMTGHDLVEPVRSIEAYAKRVLDAEGQMLTEKSRGHLSKYVVAPAHRLRCMLDDVRAFLRDILRDHEDRTQPVDLSQALTHAIEALNGTVHHAGATIERDALPLVQGHALSLQLVFQNLLSNACKYRDPDRPLRIDISAARLSPEEFQISVRDNGIGFSPSFREEVFDFGRRLHKPDSPLWGSGIGLYQVRFHVERHGGRVWAQSTPGEGTVFHFTLRALHAPPQDPTDR